MRDVKFRGLSKVTGKFVYGNLIQTSKYKDGHIHCWIQEKSLLGLGVLSTPTTRFIDVHSESVGQFTGLQDKNGADIYEKDTVYATANKSYYTVCSGEYELSSHYDSSPQECIGFYLSRHNGLSFNECESIGSDCDHLQIVGSSRESQYEMMINKINGDK
jgi:uncharacterized phage protein (TIGR01671 family)